MKILILCRSLNIGGAERQIIILAKGLQQKGYSVVVAVFYGNGTLQEDLDKAGISVLDLHKTGRWDVLPFFIRLAKSIHEIKPNVIYGFLGIPNILTGILSFFFPAIKILWGVRASNVDMKHYDWLSGLSYRIECWLSRFANKIICNSYAGLEYAANNGFPRDKMQVIQNGIDTDRFRPDIAARERMRKEWKIADKDILIGLVARLDPMKDHPTFLQAAAKLAQKHANIRFVCVGNGTESYKTQLQQLATALGLNEKLLWAGERNDMEAVFNALDIAVSSSYSEGFSNVIAEAMSCAVPCVVTEAGDSAMILGNTGIVVPSSCSDELHKGLKLMLQKLESSLKNAARERIVNLYGNDVMVEATAAVLTQLTKDVCV